MKKIVLAAFLGIFSFAGLQAQEGTFEVGPYIGAPVGDTDGTSVNTGVTFGYYFGVIPKLKVGPMIGVDHFFGKEYDRGGYHFDKEDKTFIPIAASAKFNFTERFYAGLDLGYAIGVSDAAGKGGFLARPQIGFSLPMVDIYGYFKTINYAYADDYWDEYDGPEDWDDNWNLGSVGVGAAFKF